MRTINPMIIVKIKENVLLVYKLKRDIFNLIVLYLKDILIEDLINI